MVKFHFNKKVASFTFVVGSLCLLVVPTYASTTASQTYTATVTAPTLGLSFVSPTGTGFVVPIADVSLTGSTNTQVQLFGNDTPSEMITITNTGNTQGTLTCDVSASTPSRTIFNGTVYLNQYSALSSSTKNSYFETNPAISTSMGYLLNGSASVGADTLSAQQAVYLDPAIMMPSGSIGGDYTFTYNFNLG